MNPIEYMNQMRQDIERKPLIDKLDTVMSHLDDCLVPMFETIQEIDEDLYNKDGDGERLWKSIAGSTSLIKDRSFYNDFTIALKNIKKNLQSIQESPALTKGLVITKENMTYQKNAILQIMCAVDFAMDYMTNFMLYFSDLAAVNVMDNELVTSKYQVKYLLQNAFYFGHVLDVIAKDPTAFKRDLKETPDGIIDPETYEAVSKAQKVDRLGTNKIDLNFDMSTTGNPLYWVGMLVAEIQAARFVSLVRKRDAMVIRVQAIQRQIDGKPDPVLQKELEIRERRVEQMDAEIESKGSKYGL